MKKVKLVMLLLLFVGALAALLESQSHYVGRLLDNYVLDNYNHYLTCDKLPDRMYVEKILAENTDLVNSLYNAGANAIGTGDSEMSCENTADIIIFYNGHADKVAIEKILIDHTFKGIPVRLKNV